MSKLASEQSTWLKEYRKRVYAARKKSGSNKKIMPIMILVMAGGLEAFLIFGKDGLNDPQLQGPIKIIGIVAGVMLILTTLLIALGKKTDVAKPTTDNLDKLLTTPEDVKAFDAQMQEPPVFIVENSTNYCFFATKDYLAKKSFDMGNETYIFARIEDIASLHYKIIKVNGLEKDCIVDIRNRNGFVLISGHLVGKSLREALIAGLESVARGDFRSEEEGN